MEFVPQSMAATRMAFSVIGRPLDSVRRDPLGFGCRAWPGGT